MLVDNFISRFDGGGASTRKLDVRVYSSLMRHAQKRIAKTNTGWAVLLTSDCNANAVALAGPKNSARATNVSEALGSSTAGLSSMINSSCANHAVSVRRQTCIAFMCV